MSSGLYIEKRTFFHGLDPRAKLIWTLLVLAASAAAQYNGLKSLPVFASTLAALSLSGLSAGLAFLLIVNASVFLAVVTLIWAGMYSTEGALLLAWGFFRITDVGLLVALGKFLLIMNPVLAFVAFFASTKPYHITWSLEKLGMPSKLAMTFTLALNMMPQTVRIVREVTEAQIARGLALDSGGLIQRLRNYMPIIIPVISRFITDVWDLSMVLASRYTGYTRRTYLFEPRWTLRDTGFTLASVLVYGGVIAWSMLL
ncbi:MAG: energy-coupling factor transporter transmembrane component T [Thermofilaceae archaeon]